MVLIINILPLYIVVFKNKADRDPHIQFSLSALFYLLQSLKSNFILGGVEI